MFQNFASKKPFTVFWRQAALYFASPISRSKSSFVDKMIEGILSSSISSICFNIRRFAFLLLLHRVNSGFANTPDLAYVMPKLFRWLHWGYGGRHFDSRKFQSQTQFLFLPFSQQMQFTLIVIKELYCTTKQEEGNLRSQFTRWQPSWIWAFQVCGLPQLLRVSLTIVYTCQDHVLESLKMAASSVNEAPSPKVPIF